MNGHPTFRPALPGNKREAHYRSCKARYVATKPCKCDKLDIHEPECWTLQFMEVLCNCKLADGAIQ